MRANKWATITHCRYTRITECLSSFFTTILYTIHSINSSFVLLLSSISFIFRLINTLFYSQSYVHSYALHTTILNNTFLYSILHLHCTAHKQMIFCCYSFFAMLSLSLPLHFLKKKYFQFNLLRLKLISMQIGSAWEII